MYLKYAFWIFSISMLFSSCKKTIFDYRHKYIGEYNFTLHQTTHIYGSSTVIDTVILYDGEIEYGDEDEISIPSSNGIRENHIVDKDGSVYKCGTKLGSISKKYMTLAFNSNVCLNGPNGAIIHKREPFYFSVR